MGFENVEAMVEYGDEDGEEYDYYYEDEDGEVHSLYIDGDEEEGLVIE
jgi:hypothetical protein